MYTLFQTGQFKKDLKKVLKRNRSDFEITFEVLEILKMKGVTGLPVKMKAHKLSGNYKKNWECHIKPDLLIIWIQIESPKIIKLVRLGSHSDLF
jgi:mRNA interferase YafQ